MRRILIFLAVTLALAAAPAAAALRDFRLPDASTQQPDPERVGPVAPDVPESRGVRQAPAPLPTRTAAPSSSLPAVEVPELSDPDPAPTRAARVQVPATNATVTAAPTPTTDETQEPVPSDATPAGETTPALLPSIPPGAIAAPADQGGSLWPWAAAVLAALGAIGFAGWRLWRRRSSTAPAAMPSVERPRVLPATPAAPAAAAPEPLQVTLEPLRLSLTLMNATLAYRLEIANRGAASIVDLSIGADMISAHASMTREQQLSGPGAEAAMMQRIERIEPGQSRIVEGEFRVPFTQIVPIRQGSAALLLPLARFRLAAEGAAPVVRTFVVGQPGAGAALQPFRLDLGPRVYPKLAQRAFA